MHLTDRERDLLLLVVAAKLAKERKEKGIKLNYPESVALITYEILEAARKGDKTVADLKEYGKTILSEDDVMEGVASMIEFINIEATFPDGTKLVVVVDPIKPPGAGQEGVLSKWAHPEEAQKEAQQKESE